MSTLTAVPPAAARRPVPWSRLAWVSWRQHRTALAAAGGLLAAASLYLLIEGLLMRGTAASLGLGHCRGFSGGSCAQRAALFQDQYLGMAGLATTLLQAVAGLTGVFLGAPLLGRELETGTYRFAWTQGCGRSRWALAELIPVAALLAAAALAFSLLVSWYYQPFLTQRVTSPLDPQLFDLTGTGFAAWALAAFALGAFAGTVARRVVPGMVAGLAAWTGLALVTVLYLRPHYLAPLVRHRLAVPRQGGQPWVLRGWWVGPDGRPMSASQIFTVAGRMKHAVGPRGTDADAARWLAQHHYASWVSYQPAARYWPFQLIESGWLLALAVVLGAVTIWLVRRRAA
jgi:hypothetical protein